MELHIYRIIGFSSLFFLFLFFLFREKIYRLWQNYNFARLIIDMHKTPVFENVADKHNDQHVLIKFCWVHESVITKMKESRFPIADKTAFQGFNNFGDSAMKYKMISLSIQELMTSLSFFRNPVLWIRIRILNFFWKHFLFVYFFFPTNLVKKIFMSLPPHEPIRENNHDNA